MASGGHGGKIAEPTNIKLMCIKGFKKMIVKKNKQKSRPPLNIGQGDPTRRKYQPKEQRYEKERKRGETALRSLSIYLFFLIHI